MPKFTGNNRTSALKRLNKPFSINDPNRRLLIGSKNSSTNDARQILVNPNQTSFDARQLLNRQSSRAVNTVSKNVILRNNLTRNNEDMVIVTGVKNMKMKDGRLITTAPSGGPQVGKNKKSFAAGSSTFVTIRNNNNNNTETSLNQSTEKISLTKTITNTSAHDKDDGRRSQTANTPSSSNQKVIISFVNDKYQKDPNPITSSSPSLIHYHDSSPVIKHLHDASIQTTTSSISTRSPIRTSSHRRQNSNTTDQEDYSTERMIVDDDFYEPPVKRTNSSIQKTTTPIGREQQVVSAPAPTGSIKRTSTGAPIGAPTRGSTGVPTGASGSSKKTPSVSTLSKQPSSTQPSSTSGTILVTNLQPSVTEDDVTQLFGSIGRINEITKLSQGCIQIIYAKREYGEQAVTQYHNRLLDGQLMYVSLQQPSSTSKTTSSIQQSSSTSKITNSTQQSSSNSKITSSIQKPTKESGTSASSSSTTNQPLKFNTTNTSTSSKYTIDPAFVRQALFHPSTNSNPVQFQVKL